MAYKMAQKYLLVLICKIEVFGRLIFDPDVINYQ